MKDINPRIDFAKCRDVKLPDYGTKGSAGIDFYCPNYTDSFIKDLKEKNKANHLLYEEGPDKFSVVIPPGEQICIPSGIKAHIYDPNTYLDAENKSGITIGRHLVTGAKVIDYDYRGEIHINLINVGNDNAIVECGDKLVQFIHKIYVQSDIHEISIEEYNELPETERNDGMAGSTGTK